MSILEKIDQNIKKFNKDKLFQSSINFFQTLNYPMDTLQEEANYSLDEFLEITGVESSVFLSKDNVEKIEILSGNLKQGYLTISNALQWRLQYARVISLDNSVEGVYNNVFE